MGMMDNFRCHCNQCENLESERTEEIIYEMIGSFDPSSVFGYICQCPICKMKD